MSFAALGILAIVVITFALLTPALLFVGQFLLFVSGTAAAICGSDIAPLTVPQEFLGHAYASIQFLTVGMMPLGSIVGGAIVGAINPLAAFGLGIVLMLAACVLLFKERSWVPRAA